MTAPDHMHHGGKRHLHGPGHPHMEPPANPGRFKPQYGGSESIRIACHRKLPHNPTCAINHANGSGFNGYVETDETGHGHLLWAFLNSDIIVANQPDHRISATKSNQKSQRR